MKINKINENQKKSIKINENQWKSMKINENHWNRLKLMQMRLVASDPLSLNPLKFALSPL